MFGMLEQTQKARRRVCALSGAALLSVLTPSIAMAQAAPSPGRVTLPPVTVTAQKEPADPEELPVSVTTVPQGTIQSDDITAVSDAGIFAPNTYFTDFSARKLSNARFRGIGSSPANPAITTYIDGVPQLNANSSSIEFLDVSQVEFVRGAQSALFGRNALGGLINIQSGRPSLTTWTARADVPFGNFSSFDVRANAAGPIAQNLSIGLAIGHTQRDGFTVNDITGHDLDSRDATFGKAQILFTPTSRWETRLIVSAERARDGDYALGDLAALRANPYHVARDFEGHTNRDVTQTTILARHEGSHLSFASTTGFVSWKTNDLTDLDYTPLPLITRSNDEKDFQCTQEVRVASSPNKPVMFGDHTILKWQSGVFLFTQNYDQDAVNTISPFVLSPLLPIAVDQHSPQAALDDAGVGVYGQATVIFQDRLDATVGARFDYENKKANLNTFFSPPVFPGNVVDAEKSFSNVSPQFAVSYHLSTSAMAYATVGRGFKAGGFNPASPPGSEAYDEENAWHVEGGLKTQWSKRATANLSFFTIDWSDLQLNVPNPFVPGQFYISNVGSARSSGVEFELNGRPRDGVDVFASVGYTHARFGSNSFSSGVDVSDLTIPNTPEYTLMLGTELSHRVHSSLRVYGRAEAVFYGKFWYDESNTASQDAYSLANFRGGVRGGSLFVEGWVKNAFDTFYIPVAFVYQGFAPSGFVGESGHPRTFGLRAGVSF